ncbi:hypothetical protein CHLRE_01g038800v5 [Chlamydomonas reinhardtii]|uniref:Uncharacterized protein n=1 Tax=Chlamydomonas reinhardtii TaxID=3055 RepID=A0A2K3E790_CHLRE|nr:uncharacterized protein CHLRE_01g038800v5 [Chlamydomonas reinhardtii]PNW88651.1 hypothetical protein CHLRE_01g038800v5 [Chlamydomonas reinhardtii]
MGKPVAEAQPKPPPAPLSTLVFGDFMCTSLWVVASSCFAEASEYLAEQTGLDELVLGIAVLISALTIFGPLCGIFGGALFNPINSIALLSSGSGTATSHLLRMCGQLAGAIAGSIFAKTHLPEFLQGKFHTLSGGIKEGVAFEVGFAAEGTLSFVLNYVFLMSLEAESSLLKTWTPMVSTIVLSWIGYYFTGPSLNPFVSFSWHMHYKRQNDIEHFLVFWSAPILGAVFAGLAYSFRHKPPAARKQRRPSKAAVAARAQQTRQAVAAREHTKEQNSKHGHSSHNSQQQSGKELR